MRRPIFEMGGVHGALTLITYPTFTFSSEKTLFPGLAALVPATGAALMILAGASSTFAAGCRSTIPTRIGEISYSFYLVHWPIFVFTNYILVERIPTLSTMALLAATFLSAFVPYNYVEKAFRNPSASRLNGAEFSLATLGCTVVITLLASSSWDKEGGTGEYQNSSEESTI